MIRLLAGTFVTIFLLLVAGQTLFAIARDKKEASLVGQPPAIASPAQVAPTQVRVRSSSETVIDRDASNQFRVSLLVNGQDATFLVDTGADTVALTTDDAQRLGIDVRPADFQPIMQTASGTGNGAVVMIDRLELGDTEFHDVRAVVVEGLQQNLLGQSVLRRFGNVELRGDRMIIRHD